MIWIYALSETKAMKKLVVACLLLVTTVAWAQVVQVFDSAEATSYVDLSTLRQENGGRMATDIKNLKKRAPDGTKSRVAQREYECKAKRSRILSLTTFAASMGSGTMLSTVNEPSGWVDIAPNTTGAALLNRACAK